MAEMLSSGPGARPAGPGPRRRPRWLVPVAGVLLAAVLTVLAVPSVPTRTVAPVPTPTGPPPPEAVYLLDGTPSAGPAGVRLLLGGLDPGVLDVGNGRLTPLAGLRTTSNEVVKLRRGRGFTVAFVHTGGDEFARAFVLPDAGGSVPIGAVRDVLPMRDGTLLTVVCVAGTGGGCVLGSRTATGAVRWQRRVPSEVALVRDTPYGVVASVFEGDRGLLLRLEDPRTGRVDRVLGRTDQVLAANDRRVAYQPSGCSSDCQVLVADLADGSRWTLPPAPGRPADGAFSPDGRRLALGFWGLHSQDPDPSRQRDGYAAVLDLAAGGGWHRVPRLTTGVKVAPVPVWTPDSGQLLVAVGNDRVGRVAAWRPGAPRITVLPVRLTDFFPQPGMVSVLT